MLRATWKSLFGRKLRLLMSALSIVLGVAFVAGSLMFTNLLNSVFQQVLKSTLADVNVSIEGALTNNVVFNPSLFLSPDDLAAVQGVDGVRTATATVTSGEIYPLDKDGRILVLGGAPGVAMNYFDTPAMQGLTSIRIIDGRAPQSDSEVAIDPTTLSRGGYAIGDTISIATPRIGIVSYEVVGTATFGEGATAGASYQFFTLNEMQRLLTDGQDVYTGMWVETAPDADRAAVASAIDEILPTGFDAATGDESAETLEKSLAVGLGLINTFLLVFAGIALLVASLLILNTFSILVTQRSRELALLRAMGATRGQVMSSVLAEAVVIAVLGGLVGVAAGYGLAWLIAVALNHFGVGLGSSSPALTLPIVAICLAVAILVTVVAAVIPARKASRTRPVEAMTLSTAAATQTPSSAAWWGLSMVPVGAASIGCGVFMGVPQRLWWVGIGAVVVLIGAVLSAALLGRPILAFAHWLYRVCFGTVGVMAGRNASRQPSRTAATAATLMIGLTLISSVAILASSTTASVRHSLTKNERGDFVIAPINFRPFSADLDAINAVAGVDAVWAFANTNVKIGDWNVLITGAEVEAFTTGSALEINSGELPATGNSIMVDAELALDQGLSIGSVLELPGIDGTPIEVEVTGIIDGQEAPRPIGLAVTNRETFAKIGNLDQLSMITVDAAEDADLAAIRQSLVDATSQSPTVVVTDNEEYADARVAQFNTIFGIIYALLALALVISVLGIVNTLGLSVMERTREIGLLRAVGLTRRQLRAMVRLESIVIAILGSLLGVILGVVLGTSLVSVLPDLEVIAVPWWQLVVFVVAAAVVGVLSAIGPARRAARLNILDAIATE